MRRRDFFRLSAGAALLPLAGRAAAVEPTKRLVVVLLRGAVDGLGIVAPCKDPAYYAARPTIAVPRPGGPDGGLPLDADFALHPALAPLLPLWSQRQLAFIHAAGSPDPTRSHFDAQRYIETGTPGQNNTADGWMNRLLAALPPPHGPTEAIALGPILPRILSGRMPVANVARRGGAAEKSPLDQPGLGDALDRLYAGDSPQDRAFREGRKARAQLAADLAGADRNADAGAPGAYGMGPEMARLARLLAADPTIRLAFADYGGWDTHVNQKGQLASRLKAFGGGLATLAKGLGPQWASTVVVVLSEFGRTVHENGDAGTDHGHGNAIWLLGGAVAGGKVYGEWPGLAADRLYQRRDLAVTTDFRCALAAILERHLRLDDKTLAAVFPGLPAASPDLRKILTA